MIKACPVCSKPIELLPVKVIYGVRDGTAEVLAAGNLQLSVCCNVAVLAEKIEEKPTIITPPQGIILP